MIKITTDSTCDLPARLLEQHNISVIPLGIVKGDRLYRDGIDIRTADIAAHVDAGGDLTTTNAVNIADYEMLFREQTEQYEAVIHLNIGAGFSSCYQNAKLAAEEVPAGEWVTLSAVYVAGSYETFVLYVEGGEADTPFTIRHFTLTGAAAKQEEPLAEAGGKKYVCKICGYVYEGDTLPEDFVCPLCKHGAADFEEITE